MTKELHNKRNQGQYFTKATPFHLSHFKKWTQYIKLAHSNILEPFAGANDLITSLESLKLCRQFTSYDIVPAHT